MINNLICMFIDCSTLILCHYEQVIKYESVIHEFDPYFNYRVTQVWFLFLNIIDFDFREEVTRAHIKGSCTIGFECNISII